MLHLPCACTSGKKPSSARYAYRLTRLVRLWLCNNAAADRAVWQAPVQSLNNLEDQQNILDLAGGLHRLGQGRKEQLRQGGASEGVSAVSWVATDGQVGQAAAGAVCFLAALLAVLGPATHETSQDGTRRKLAELLIRAHAAEFGCLNESADKRGLDFPLPQAAVTCVHAQQLSKDMQCA